jgi:hypothetical protein
VIHDETLTKDHEPLIAAAPEERVWKITVEFLCPNVIKRLGCAVARLQSRAKA